MNNDESQDEDGSAEEPERADDHNERIQLTPEQAENLRRALASIQLPRLPALNVSAFALADPVLKTIAAVSRIAESQQAIVRAIQPMLAVQSAWQKQVSSVTGNLYKSIAPALADIGRITEQLNRSIDFSGISASLEAVSKISATFAEQQSALFRNLGPAITAMRAGFYPPNLRKIEDLEFADVTAVVMADGIPLFGLPRAATAEALIRAGSAGKRREILGRRWKTIAADCREALLACTSGAVAPYAPFAVAALDAGEAGHTAAAQALAGSLVDTVVNAYFGDDRYRYTPNSKTLTNEAYSEFTIREYIAFAPMWQAYQQFFVSKGDAVPTRFNRHATAHAVSARQFSRRNAIQAVMFACSLLYRLDEEAVALESAA